MHMLRNDNTKSTTKVAYWQLWYNKLDIPSFLALCLIIKVSQSKRNAHAQKWQHQIHHKGRYWQLWYNKLDIPSFLELCLIFKVSQSTCLLCINSSNRHTYLHNICSIRCRHKIKRKTMFFGKIKTLLCYIIVNFGWKEFFKENKVLSTYTY